MKKILIATAMAGIMGVTQCVPVMMAAKGENPISVTINGQKEKYSQDPVVVNGHTLVPLRGIFETLGAKVVWDQKTRLITATKGDITIKLAVGNMMAYVNGKAVKLATPAQLKNGSTMVPLRFISESLGAEVLWKKESNTITIFTASTSDNSGEKNENASTVTGTEETSNGESKDDQVSSNDDTSGALAGKEENRNTSVVPITPTVSVTPSVTVTPTEPVIPSTPEVSNDKPVELSYEVLAINEVTSRDQHVSGKVSEGVKSINIYLNDVQVQTYAVDTVTDATYSAETVTDSTYSTFYGYVADKLKAGDVIKVEPVNAQAIKGKAMEITVEASNEVLAISGMTFKDTVVSGKVAKDVQSVDIYLNGKQVKTYSVQTVTDSTYATFNGHVADQLNIGDRIKVEPIDAQGVKGTSMEITVTNNKLFYKGDATGSTWFRIPFLLTTSNDTLIAGADTNFASTGDSAENIDTAIMIKENASTYSSMEGWSDPLMPNALHMYDYADETGYKQKSASFIDGAIVQDALGSGRIIILIDAWTWNGGVLQQMNVNSQGLGQGGTARTVAYGDGFATLGDKKYLLLSDKNIKGNDTKTGAKGVINNNTNRALFNYVADIYGEKDANGHYKVYHLVGTPNPYPTNGTTVNDTNLSLGELSEYSLNSDYELYKNKEPLTVLQKSKDSNYPKTQVSMKIFYEDSELQMYNTAYLIQIYSDDEGKTWHTDKLMSGMTKRENSTYYILGPGAGIQIQNGKYAGRIIMPVYHSVGPSAEVMYSDDGGVTWDNGEPIPKSSGTPTESAPVEMPDGSLKMFSRNGGNAGGKILVSTSVDGGVTWRDVQSALGDKEKGVNSQVSALRLSQNIKSKKDGQYYPAVLVSSPNDRARVDGRIFVGLIKEDGFYDDGAKKYKVDFEYEYKLTGAKQLYGYSCMTELANGRVGIIYESSETSSWVDGLNAMYYEELTIEQLTATAR